MIVSCSLAEPSGIDQSSPILAAPVEFERHGKDDYLLYYDYLLY